VLRDEGRNWKKSGVTISILAVIAGEAVLIIYTFTIDGDSDTPWVILSVAGAGGVIVLLWAYRSGTRSRRRSKGVGPTGEDLSQFFRAKSADGSPSPETPPGSFPDFFADDKGNVRRGRWPPHATGGAPGPPVH
jgi:hypothetical protein